MFTRDESRVNFGIFSSREESLQFAALRYSKPTLFFDLWEQFAQETFESIHAETSILTVRSRWVNVITVSHKNKMLLSRKFSFICYLTLPLVFTVDSDSQRGKQIYFWSFIVISNLPFRARVPSFVSLCRLHCRLRENSHFHKDRLYIYLSVSRTPIHYVLAFNTQLSFLI